LSIEYLHGRRASYLHPIRMYVFTSAIFFLIFYSLIDVKHIASTSNLNMNSKGIESFRSASLKSAKTKTDSQSVEAAYAAAKKFALPEDSISKRHVRGLRIGLQAGNLAYTSIAQYDSVQAALSPRLRDNWLQKRFTYKIIEITSKSEAGKRSFLAEWFSEFIHHLGQLLFISLPIFALLLRFLYVRRKEFLYVDHAIFSIHLYIFSFIFLMLYFGIEFMKEKTGWNWLWVIETGIALFAFNYYYRAMLRFYRQGWLKTTLKFILLCIFSFFMNIVLITIFSLFSLWET
jgi:hypothetical protein